MSYTPSYTRKNFVDGQAPSINANNMNDIEDTLVNLEQFAQSADEAISDNAEAILAEATARTAAIEAEATARENLEEATTEALTEVNKNLSVLANFNIQTSNDTLDWAMDGNIVSAKFEGYAYKSKNLLGNDANVYYPIDIKNGDVYSVTKANGIAEADIRNLSFYDENKNYITDLTMNGYVTRTLIYPSGRATAKYIKWANDSKPVYDLMFNIGQPLPFEPYGIIMPSGVVESVNNNLYKGERLNAVVESSTVGISGIFVARTTDVCSFVKVNKNTDYYISYTGDRCSVFGSTVEPQLNVSATVLKNDVSELKKHKVVVNSGNYEYLTIYTNTQSGAKPTDMQIEQNGFTEYVQHEESAITLPYIPYGVNNIHDELIVNADGSGKYVKRVNSVDLGSLVWSKLGTNRFNSNAIASLVKYPQSATELANVISDSFTTVNFNVAYAESVDKSVAITPNTTSTVGNINIIDKSYADTTSFKNAMNGVMLYYELSTEEVINLTSSEVAQILALKTFADTTYIDADGMAYTIGYAQNSAKAIKELQNIIKNLTSTQTMDDEAGQIVELTTEE